MAKKWISSKYSGIRYWQHPTRKHGVKFDRYYTIRHQKDGKRVEEGLGWSSNGWTEQKAVLVLAELKQAETTGRGETSLKERRATVRAKKRKEKINALTFANFFIETYYPQAQANKAVKTCVREEIFFRLWIGPVIGDKPLNKVSPLHLERIKKNMGDAGRAPRSIHYCLAVIRQVFNLAGNLSLYDGDNPVNKVKKPNEDNKRTRYLTTEEATILLQTLKSRVPQLHDMALLSLHTGMRAGELFNLKWGNVDLDNDIIMVVDTKSGRNRAAYLTTETRAMLELRGQREPSDLVFTDKKGRRIKELTNPFSRIVKDLDFNDGIKDRRQRFCFHTLRHTFASRLVQGGTGIYVVRDLLGHSTIAMTERYSHLSDGSRRDAILNMEQTLARQKKKVIRIHPTT